ncbi:MAG TPA: DUF4058 family protein [Planctomycetota bacterium]|nr:DUF4058 family protein [Planctomycetota bacterium]
MKSPFPGMDPYLEYHWGDVHQRLITYICDEIQPKLPHELFARTAERVYLNTPGSQRYFPDVRIVSEPETAYAVEAPAAEIKEAPSDAAAVEEPFVEPAANPVIVPLDCEELTESFIEVVDAKTERKVISVIEVLSPSNKAQGEGRSQYCRKREECRGGGVNFIEIDLLRDGERNLTAPEERIPLSHHTPYRICVWRATQPLVTELYAVSLRQRIPPFRIPLRMDDSDLELDLQPLLERCYINGRYERIDYTKEPIPPLSPVEARWADELLRAAKLRGGEKRGAV